MCPKRWFLILGASLGLAYSSFIAPWHAQDEEEHTYRAYVVSQGSCAGRPAILENADYIGGDFRDMYRRFNWTELPANSTVQEVVCRIDSAHPATSVQHFTAVNIYSCLPYLPAALALRVGRAFSITPVSLLYLGRIANLTCYLLLFSLALWLLPEFQAPIAALALMPMALHQGSVLSVDSITISLAFVLTAYIVRLSVADDTAPLERAQYLWLAAGMLAIGLCKADAGLSLLILLIPAARFRNARMRWLAVAGYVVLAYATAAVWQYLDRPNGDIFVVMREAVDKRPGENAAFILQHPLDFLSAVWRSLNHFKGAYISEFAGTLGRLEIHLPGRLPELYVALLIVFAAVSRAGARLRPWQRILLAVIFALNILSVFAAVWTTELSHSLIASHIDGGWGVIEGVVGRYLIPFALLFLVAVSGLIPRIPRAWVSGAALLLIAAVNLVALRAVWNLYESHRSTLPNRLRMAAHLKFSGPAQLYDHRLIAAWNAPQAEAYLVSDGTRHSPSGTLLLTRRGFRWPDDVLLISDEELAAIPAGEPLPGSRTHEGELVRQPLDTKVYLVRGAARHWVCDGRWVANQGLKWPDDINVIPSLDFAAIPLSPTSVGCGSTISPSAHEGELVRRAGSSVADGKIYVVREGVKHWVWDSKWITAHGYKWPGDLHVISAEDLASIPEGINLP